MKTSLIICPSGNPIPTMESFDSKAHWRNLSPHYNPSRKYVTHIVSYNEFEHDKSSYDSISHMKGMKWSIAKELLKTLDYSQYEYIGFIDDDLLITQEAINKSLMLAHSLESKIFQLSLDPSSDCAYHILYQNPNLLFSETNFVEIMAPFIHTSIIPTIQKFWDKYDIDTGWGFDFGLCNIVNENALVIHNHSMIHPKKPASDYDKTTAAMEQHLVASRIYPEFMQEQYGISNAQLSIHPQILRRWTK